jgi:hypothetical protein
LTYFTINDPQEPIPMNEPTTHNKYTLKKTNELEGNSFQIEETNQYIKPSKLKVALFWICGIESSLKKDFNPDKQIEHEIDTSINQDPFWSNICDLNAVFAIALSGFTLAFYNRYE